MKSPMEIARETLGADALAGIGYEQHLPYMVRAIEADRAQSMAEGERLVHVRCGTRVSDQNVTPGYFAVCPKCDEDLYTFEVRPDPQHAADIATLADAAEHYADSIIENMESMREDDDDRVTDQAEYNEIFAAINRLTGTNEARP